MQSEKTTTEKEKSETIRHQVKLKSLAEDMSVSDFPSWLSKSQKFDIEFPSIGNKGRETMSWAELFSILQPIPENLKWARNWR